MTLRNFRNATLVAIVVFVIVSVRSELRGRNIHGDYGRLYGSQVRQEVSVEREKPEIIVEAPVPESTHADPMLIAAAAREQYLRGTEQPVGTVAEPVQASVAAAPLRGAEGDLAIVGGPEGVTVVKTETSATPKLSGGIFADATRQ